MSKKRIGLVLPNTPAYSETFFKSKIEGLIDNGYEVLLFVGNSTNPKIPNTRIYKQLKIHKNIFIQLIKLIWVLLIATIFYPKILKKYIQLEKSEGISFQKLMKNIYINHHILKLKKLEWLHFGFATMAIRRELVAKTLGAKMAVSLRGFDVCIYPLKHQGIYDRLWLFVDKVHTISDDLLKVAYGLGLSTEIPFQKITPAVDIKFFQETANIINFSKGEPIQFLTIARLHWKKGIVYVLKALSILKKEGVSFDYYILGEGPEREQLLYDIQDLDLLDCVHLVGKASRQVVKEFLIKSNIYIQYSIQEGFCNAVLEAQAMGKLCIVSDAEGLSENVENEKSGWIVSKREPIKLLEKIKMVIRLPKSDLHQISMYAVQRVKKSFNIKKQQEEFLEFYES